MINLVSLYKAIFTQLNTIKDSKGKPIFKNIAVFNDQPKRLGNPKTAGTWLTPSIFVEMKFDEVLNLGRALNAEDITYYIHIVMQQLDAGNGTLDQNLYIFTLRDLVHKCLCGWTPFDQAGPLRYKYEKQQYNHTNLYEYIIEYQNHYFDTTAYNLGISATFSTVEIDIDVLPLIDYGIGWMVIESTFVVS